MANKKTSEYTVTMRLREVVPKLETVITSQTHLMAIRLAAALHPAYIPERVTLNGTLWRVFGCCILCGAYILEGDRFAPYVVERDELKPMPDGSTERQRTRIEGVECCECRAQAPAGQIAKVLTASGFTQ